MCKPAKSAEQIALGRLGCLGRRPRFSARPGSSTRPERAMGCWGDQCEFLGTFKVLVRQLKRYLQTAPSRTSTEACNGWKDLILRHPYLCFAGYLCFNVYFANWLNKWLKSFAPGELKLDPISWGSGVNKFEKKRRKHQTSHFWAWSMHCCSHMQTAHVQVSFLQRSVAEAFQGRQKCFEDQHGCNHPHRMPTLFHQSGFSRVKKSSILIRHFLMCFSLSFEVPICQRCSRLNCGRAEASERCLDSSQRRFPRRLGSGWSLLLFASCPCVLFGFGESTVVCRPLMFQRS